MIITTWQSILQMQWHGPSEEFLNNFKKKALPQPNVKQRLFSNKSAFFIDWNKPDKPRD